MVVEFGVLVAGCGRRGDESGAGLCAEGGEEVG